MTRVFFSLLASVAGARIIGLMTGLMMTSALLAALAAPAYAETRQDAVIGLQLEPPHLDPTSAAAGAIDQVLYANVYEGLTRFTENGNIIPHLAASWDISDDGRRYQFTLQSRRKDLFTPLSASGLQR